METIFGDGSQQQKQQGVMARCSGRQAPAHRRVALHDRLPQPGPSQAQGGLRRPYPGKIQPVHLAELGGELLAQKDSFLVAAKGVAIGIAFQKRLGVGLFGGEGSSCSG